jgi:hypothetical protein
METKPKINVEKIATLEIDNYTISWSKILKDLKISKSGFKNIKKCFGVPK